MWRKILIPVGFCVAHAWPCPISGHEHCGPDTQYDKCPSFRKVVYCSAYEETDQDGKRRIHLTAPEVSCPELEARRWLCDGPPAGQVPNSGVGSRTPEEDGVES